MVARRTFEIGVRVALGAQQHDVFGLVVRRGLILAATGLVVGLAGFAIFGRVVADMLYGVRTFDPFVVATACAVLLVVALLASTGTRVACSSIGAYRRAARAVELLFPTRFQRAIFPRTPSMRRPVDKRRNRKSACPSFHLIPVTRQGLSRWRGGRYAWGERKSWGS